MKVFQAPEGSGRVELGRTLPSLLDEAVQRNPNPGAFQQRTDAGWEPLGTEAFRRRAEALAAGLLGRGLTAGDRVALFVYSDVSFCLADMACLMAGLVSVPVYLTHTPSAVRHILTETGCRALLASGAELLERVVDLVDEIEPVELVGLWGDEPPRTAPARAAVASFAELEREGAGGLPTGWREGRRAEELITILYTSGTTGLPKGVMLTHQNISSNVIAAMSGLTTFRPGPAEVVLSFLPLTHIFARTLQYGVMWFGSTVYFSDPQHFPEDLRGVRPTFFAAVPRVVEKAYERIRAAGGELTGARRRLFDWALAQARAFDVEHPPTGLARLGHRVADRFVFRRWREALGGRLHTVIIGGAALRSELATVFKAAGIDMLQGYGLTETSPVVAFNRPDRNRPGTVGPALAGTEIAVADDGEVLARGPHIMLGYYGQPELTAEALDRDGWFHTGDRGSIDDDGYLRITGRIKHLFKLSTGKYVMPQPLEERLEAEPLVATALVVGEGEKYCGALLFVARDVLAERHPGRVEDALASVEVRGAYRDTVAAANRDMPAWSTIKRFALVADELTVESGAVTPKLSVRREAVLTTYRGVVEALYHDVAVPDGVAIVEV